MLLDLLDVAARTLKVGGHLVYASDSLLTDAHAPLVLRVPTTGVVEGLGIDALGEETRRFWRGVCRLPWAQERLLHLLAATSPTLHRADPALLRAIAAYAAW